MTVAFAGLGIGLAVAAFWYLLVKSNFLEGTGIAGLCPLMFAFLIGFLAFDLKYGMETHFEDHSDAIYLVSYLSGIAIFFLVLNYGPRVISRFR